MFGFEGIFQKIGRLVVALALVAAVFAGVAVGVLTQLYYAFDHSEVTENSDYRTDDLFVYLAGDADEAYADRFYTVFAALDGGVREVLKERWVFVITDTVPADAEAETAEYLSSEAADPQVFQDYDVAGLTATGDRIVYLFVADDDEESAFEENLVHELGHVVSHELGRADRSREFYALYAQYKDTYDLCSSNTIPEYGAMNSIEFFACLYGDYVLYGDEMLDRASELYTYIDGINKDMGDTLTFAGRLRGAVTGVLRELYI